MISVLRQEIENAAAGDMKAFEDIYRKTCNFVYGVALGMCADKQEAEEITQDVFLKVYKGLKSFEYRSSLKTWIYRIAINTTLSHVKRLSFRKNVSLEVGAEHLWGIEAPNIQDKEGHEKIVSRALSALNLNQRLCMILRHAEQMSYEEISETLKINVNTVRTHLRRGREKLLLLRKGDLANEV